MRRFFYKVSVFKCIINNNNNSVRNSCGYYTCLEFLPPLPIFFEQLLQKEFIMVNNKLQGFEQLSFKTITKYSELYDANKINKNELVKLQERRMYNVEDVSCRLPFQL